MREVFDPPHQLRGATGDILAAPGDFLVFGRDALLRVLEIQIEDAEDPATRLELLDRARSTAEGTKGDPERAFEIARRARGTPRIANRLLRRVRDFAEVRAGGQISRSIADQALNMLDVDERGFDHQDRRLLLAMIDKFDGGPVGIDNLAAAIGEERGTIEDVLEPYLIQQGYIMRTPRGRVVTRHAYLHFGLNLPKRLGEAPVTDLFGGDE